eukprot:6344336-Pyramimonas_sp.AAC.1
MADAVMAMSRGASHAPDSAPGPPPAPEAKGQHDAKLCKMRGAGACHRADANMYCAKGYWLVC